MKDVWKVFERMPQWKKIKEKKKEAKLTCVVEFYCGVGWSVQHEWFKLLNSLQ